MWFRCPLPFCGRFAGLGAYSAGLDLLCCYRKTLEVSGKGNYCTGQRNHCADNANRSSSKGKTQNRPHRPRKSVRLTTPANEKHRIDYTGNRNHLHRRWKSLRESTGYETPAKEKHRLREHDTGRGNIQTTRHQPKQSHADRTRLLVRYRRRA